MDEHGEVAELLRQARLPGRFHYSKSRGWYGCSLQVALFDAMFRFTCTSRQFLMRPRHMLDGDNEARRLATEALVTNYFAASSQDAIDAAEQAILALTSGAITTTRNITLATGDSGEAAWLGDLQRVVGGLLCPVLFGNSFWERRRLAHLVLEVAVAHPGGSGTTRIVPVIGPAYRMPEQADGVLGQSPCDILYCELAVLARKLAASTANPVNVSAENVAAEFIASLASTFSRLAAGWNRQPRTWIAWSESELVVCVQSLKPLLLAPGYEDQSPHVRVFDNGTALIVVRATAIVVNLTDGTIVSARDTCGMSFLAAPSPQLAFFNDLWASDGLDGARVANPIYALDLANGNWVQAPADAPRVRFVEVSERALLFDDVDRHIELRAIGDYPTISEFTPDHRFFWVADKHSNHGVFRVRDGALVTMCAPRGRTCVSDTVRLTRKGTLAMTSRDWQRPDNADAAAIVRTPRGRWLSFADGIVSEGWRSFMVIDGATTAAAFDRLGSILAIIDAKNLRVIDVGEAPKQRASWPLAPYVAAAKQVRANRPRPTHKRSLDNA